MKHFNIPMTICVNKYDINQDLTKRIEQTCHKLKLPFVGKIPYDVEAVKAVNRGLTIVDITCEAGESTKKIYEKTTELLGLM